MARRPSGRQILQAYELLGISPGATAAQARRAFRTRAKEVHPDLHPEEEQARWTEAMRLLSEAFELVQGHIQRGGGLADLTDIGPVARMGSRVTIWELIAPAGAGKTMGWTNGLRRRRGRGGWRPVGADEVFPPGMTFRMNQTSGVSEVFEGTEPQDVVLKHAGFQWPPQGPYRVIYAAPTIDLVEETRAALEAAGVPCTAIHSRSEGSGLVKHKLARFFAAMPADAGDTVLLMSHDALFALPQKWIKPATKKQPERVIFDKADWDITIDEAPEVMKFYAEVWPLTAHHICSRVEALDFSDYLYQLVPTVNAVTMLRMLGGDVPEDTNLGEGLREIAAALCKPSRLVLVAKEQWDDLMSVLSGANPFELLYGGTLDVLVLLSPASVENFRSVTVMGARLDTTMYHTLWRKLFLMEYRTHPLQADLPARHTNGRRLTLHYLTTERATRQLLASKSEDGTTMFAAMAERIADYFKPPLKHRQFVWTAPLDRGSVYGVKDTFFERHITRPGTRPGQRPFDPALRLAGKSMGLNRFRQYHNAVLLTVVNFSPNQFVILHALGFSDREIDRALAHNVAYQDCLRCSLRMANVKEQVHVVCIDRATALDVGGDFPGCKLRELSNAPKRAPRRRPGPKSEGKTPAQRQKEYRDRVRLARQMKRETDRETEPV